MILLRHDSLHYEQFFETLEKHGCKISEISKSKYRISDPSKHFLEIWNLSEEYDFIDVDHVERIAELLGIDLREFYPHHPGMNP